MPLAQGEMGIGRNEGESRGRERERDQGKRGKRRRHGLPSFISVSG